MKYPLFWKKFNTGIAYFAGILALVIAGLSVYESISRHFFNSPTSWTLQFSCYMLVWSIFLGSSYAFQQGGHVGVDMVLDAIDKRTKGKKRMPRRIMLIIGNIITFIFMVVILWGVVLLSKDAIQYNILTASTRPIPIIILYIGMIVGTIMMLITLIFIVLDLLSGSDDYM